MSKSPVLTSFETTAAAVSARLRSLFQARNFAVFAHDVAMAALAFVATLLLGFGVSTSYRSGRYDSVGMLLSAAVVAAALRPAGPGTNAAVFVGAALLPWAGLQLLPYWFCLGAIAWLVAGRAALPRLVMIASALVAGAAGLAAFYQSHGVLDAFLGAPRTYGGTLRFKF